MQVFSYELDIAPNSTWNFITATADAKANFIHLQEVGYFFARDKYYTTRQGLDSFLIKLTVSGSGILEYGGHKERVGPGNFYWIDCQNWQNYYTDPEVGHWDVIWAHFNGATVRAYYETFRKMLGSGTYVGIAAQDSSILTLLETLLNKTLTPDSPFTAEQSLFEFDVQISGIITQLLIECISSAKPSEKKHRIPPMISDIRSYLTANYAEKITLDHLAARFNLDPYYLQKLFKKHIGQSPIEYIIYLRMAHARSLLRTGSMTISEIAYKVGVENISHFARQFKKLEGISPGQYRKLWTTE